MCFCWGVFTKDILPHPSNSNVWTIFHRPIFGAFQKAKCLVWEEERERKVWYLRQRGSSVPDSWLNFRWTLSNCRVRTNSCGTMAAELSLSKLSFRLLRNRGKRTKEWLRKSDKVHSAWRGGSVRKIISQLLTQNCYLILWKRRDFYRKVASTLMINRHVVLVS